MNAQNFRHIAWRPHFLKHRLGRFMRAHLKAAAFFPFFSIVHRLFHARDSKSINLKPENSFKNIIFFFKLDVACGRFMVFCGNFTVTRAKSDKKMVGCFAIILSWHFCTKRPLSFLVRFGQKRRPLDLIILL